jgi:hypothetical protein
VRIGARRAAAALLALALPAPAVAHAAPWPNDPEFMASGGPSTPWVKQIHWTPPPPLVGWPSIAVVDSGLYTGLDDFAGYLDDQSATCVSTPRARAIRDPSQVNDTFGHGTRVATIAAAPANGRGTVGVSPDSQLIVVKFTTANSNFNAVCAFNYLAGIARTGQLLVVNLSFTMPKTAGAQAALRRLIAAGALVVAASGNTSDPVAWPASEPHVLAVGRGDPGATTQNSSGGPRLDLVAPGGGLRLFDINDRQWHTGDDPGGTSYAAPMVAGVAARVWGTYTDVEDPQVIAYLLRLTASGRGKFGSLHRGFGMVNLTAATRVALSAVPQTDESDPHDSALTATRKIACRSTCRLRGIVASTDDNHDYWRLARRRCPRGKIRALKPARVKLGCFRDHGRAVVIVSARKNSQVAYTIVVPRR